MAYRSRNARRAPTIPVDVDIDDFASGSGFVLVVAVHTELVASTAIAQVRYVPADAGPIREGDPRTKGAAGRDDQGTRQISATPTVSRQD